MAWRGVHLSQPARLSLIDGQILVEQADGNVRLPIEDVAWIVLDTAQATLTAALLAACMNGGVAIIVTSANHMPNGVMLPFHGHHRQADIAHRQVAMGEPLKKRLWQAIIRAKITNQARHLSILGREEATTVGDMARHVGSGDPDNVEARAARCYWQGLFTRFRRGDEDDRRNKLLNYGYAIVRSALARAQVASGLLPAFGLHHASVTNAFNLTDDLIEPFRPFVDRLAYEQTGEDDQTDLSLADRRAMAGILLCPARLGDDEVTVLAATEMVAASLVRAMVNQDAKALILPVFPP